MTVSRKNFERITRFAPAIDWLARQIRIPVIGRLFFAPWFIGFRRQEMSRGRVVPLNVELPVGEGKVLPSDLLEKLVRKASYRVVFNWCFCRTGMNCQKYPQDFGCLMLGEATRGLVEKGVAREVDEEEALNVVRRGKELGLVHMVMWIKGETHLLANRRSEAHRMLEICQCCPCCCLALRNVKHLKGAARERWKGIGFTARRGDGCNGCGDCAEICPMDIISIEEGEARFGEGCLGCGLCASHCPRDAIEMISGGKDPVGEDLFAYFEGIEIS